MSVVLGWLLNNSSIAMASRCLCNINCIFFSTAIRALQRCNSDARIETRAMAYACLLCHVPWAFFSGMGAHMLGAHVKIYTIFIILIIIKRVQAQRADTISPFGQMLMRTPFWYRLSLSIRFTHYTHSITQTSHSNCVCTSESFLCFSRTNGLFDLEKQRACINHI